MEEKVKSRGWVKNAAIIFLAVMLVLTFFSNTIMNHSLPEAATQAVSGGTIDSKVRGTGTVTAAENYEVILDQSRKVQSVLVKVGDEVQTGDVLFILEEGSSEELEAAQETLRQLNIQYQRALIQATDNDYAKENRDISLAREALAEAQEKRDSLVLDESALANAEAAVAAAKSETLKYEADVQSCKRVVTTREKELEAAQDKLDSLGGLNSPDDSTLTSLYNQIQAKDDELKKANDELETLLIVYGTEYAAIKADAETKIRETEEFKALTTQQAQTDYINSKLSVYMAVVVEELRNTTDPSQLTGEVSKLDKTACIKAYESILNCQESIDQLQAESDALWAQYSSIAGEDNTGVYNRYKKLRDQAQAALDEANEKLEDAQASLDAANEVVAKKEAALKELQDAQAEYIAAADEAEQCQRELENLLFALQEQQKQDNITQQLEDLDMQDLLAQISQAQEEVDSLSGGGGSSEVKASVNGIIQSISVSAGHTANAGTALAVIEVPDLGYSLSFSVTNDQAKLVRMGDTASVYNYYWGSEVMAELTAIKTDPQNPQSSKLLTFKLTGDVSSGESLSLSVGQKSAQYDYVVPNSAIRTDNNGSFVLVVTAKSSPLSTRYIATRVDVEVIASDDNNSAVTGALNAGDFVITTSNKPVSSGDQVKLPDTIS